MRIRTVGLRAGLALALLAGGCGGSGGGGGGAATLQELLVLDAANTIWRFAPSAPGTPLGSFAVGGLAAGNVLVGIDVRPGTGQLYGLAVDANGTGVTAQLVSIETFTGAATPVGPAHVLSAGAPDAGYGFDFNPTLDRIRIVNSADVNIRLTASTGALAGTDAAINPAGQQIEGIAYDRNTPGGGASDTTLYAINPVTAQLVTIGGINGSPSPNTGTLLNPLPLGTGIDSISPVSFDVFGTDEAFAIFDGDPGGATSMNVYRVTLATGTATLVGPLGPGPTMPVRGLALR